MTLRPARRWAAAVSLALALVAAPALSQNAKAEPAPALSFYGAPGHVEMPSAFTLPDGNLAFSVNATSAGTMRGNLVFQISPRVTGTFRYSYIRDFYAQDYSVYDRSFDLRVLLMAEDRGGWRPAVSLGLQDFGGTGIFSGEYLVASRHFGEKITASAGIGWGRYGSYGSFSNPLGVISDRFKTRPGKITDIGDTGQINAGSFFRGDAALFFGVDWQATDRLRLSAEYSSDAMADEVRAIGYDHRSPINLGLAYRLKNGAQLQLAVLNGSTAALGYSVVIDPGRPAAPSGREPAPPAIAPGAAEAVASWGHIPDDRHRARLAGALDAQGIRLRGVEIAGDTAVIAVMNDLWPVEAQAWGRTARVLSAELPAEVTTFRLRSYRKGMPLTEITLQRDDLEELEFAPDGAWQIWSRAGVADAARLPDPRAARDRTLDLRFRPYLQPSYFDPSSPLRADAGAEVFAEWTPVHGLYLSGALRQKLAGNLSGAPNLNSNDLHPVRTDGALYARDTTVPFLTAEYFARPADALYARVSLGMLERMYGGLSAELLWAPAGRNLALGVEVNRVRQRDYDGIGFLDYSITTGHVSAYYDMGGGFLGQLDAGRYLAGDWGSTLTLTRRFGNGFEVGAFATITDVPFDDFGEGSFDKGITFAIPVSWLTGEATRAGTTFAIRPIQRDGGARVEVRNRLYGLTATERAAANGEGWSRFWR